MCIGEDDRNGSHYKSNRNSLMFLQTNLEDFRHSEDLFWQTNDVKQVYVAIVNKPHTIDGVSR